MTQYVINIGALPNDGTGDPLRTAFNETNLNFTQVFAAGPVLSNVQIANNTILTTNTNGNLVLAPNGIGVVQSNVSIVPNTSNIRNLGSNAQRWSALYIQYANISGNLDLAGTFSVSDLSVSGNLTVTGNTIQIGNLITDAKTIQLANTASTANAANGSGITVGANDNIATMLYSSSANAWIMNVGLSVTGNIGGNITAPGVNQDVVFNNNGVLGTSTASGFNYDTAANTLYVKAGSFSGEPTTGTNGLFAGLGSFTVLGSDIMAQFTGNTNAYSQVNFQNVNGSPAASGDYIITADNGTDSTHFVDLGITSSTWDGTQPNSLGNRLGPNDGYLYVQDGDFVLGTNNGSVYTWKFDQAGNLTTPGNIVPATNNTYSLGNATNQWSDLYVSNATIYMNNVPITLGAGNVFTVDGNAVLTNNSNTTISTTGNITADYFFGNVSLATGLPVVPTNVSAFTNDAEYITTSTANVISVNGQSGVVTLTIPTATSNLTNDSGFITLSDIPSNVSAFNNDAGYITNNVTGNIDASGNITADNLVANANVVGNNATFTTVVTARNLNADGGNISLNPDFGLIFTQSNAVVTANTASWTFDESGTLTLPDGYTIGNGGFNGTASSTVSLNALSPDGNTVSFQAQGNTSNAIIQTYANNTATTNIWTFDNSGNLTLPADGFLRVTSGIVGTGASPAPTLSGFSTLSAVTANISGNVTGGNLISNNGVYANVDLIVGDRANASASKGRFVSNSGFMYLQVGNGTAGSTGNIVFSPYQNSTAKVTIDTASGNLAAVGNISAGNISAVGNIAGNTAGYAIGYRDIPQVGFTGNTTIATTDAGKHFYSTESTDYTLIIANNASQGFQVGAAITIINQGTGNITIAQGSGVTLYLAGNAIADNRSVATFGMATIMKVATDTWFINGTGVS